MPYRPIDTERKTKLILEHLKGARICFLARKYGVNEDSIHLWKNKVLSALSQILPPKTPGPRPRRRVEILEEELSKLRKEYETLSQLSQIAVSTKAPSLLEERPSKCPKCGATRIWKNGTYQVKGERTSRSLIVKEKGTVQRFRCSKCGVKLYLVKKNQNEEIEKVEIHLEEAILTSEPLKDIFSFKEEIISLEKVELSSNLGSSSFMDIPVKLATCSG